MSRSGIVNVRMVITEEKILSNIEKIQKIINPNSKKQIVQLQEDTYFKDLIQSVKSYLVEYPKKKNFPVNVYNAAYDLVEYSTKQFQENTKKIEELIRQREENIALAGELKELISIVEQKQKNWKDKVKEAEETGKFSEDIIETLNILGKTKVKKSKNYIDSMKLLNARVNNLETNLHIEIDMERKEDMSQALSYIGIEIADALNGIPAPEQVNNEDPEEAVQLFEEEETFNVAELADNIEKQGNNNTVVNAIISDNNVNEQDKKYKEETTFEVKPNLWQKIKNSKLFRAATYIFRIRIRIELPDALPEGKGE